MTVLQVLCQRIFDWPLATALRESDDVFPLMETVHVLAICLIVGTIVTVDLRLLGLIMRKQSVTRVVLALLPFTWYGFGLMVATGVPLFAAESLQLYGNPAFRLKLALLSMAGCNALLFHRTVYRSVDALNFPLIADEDRKVARLYGMIHPQHDELYTVRTVFVIDPRQKIRLTITYPQTAGRNFDEVLRVIDSLQLTDSYSVSTPVNWKAGQDVIIVPSVSRYRCRATLSKGLAGIQTLLAADARPAVIAVADRLRFHWLTAERLERQRFDRQR
jgi:AhpC/TSA family/C-terminal domain of 1-Cys peroxiredoxin